MAYTKAMIQNRIQPGYLIAIVLGTSLFALVPHPPNAVPIAAMALFAGAFFSNRVLAFIVPLAAMILSDLAIRVSQHGLVCVCRCDDYGIDRQLLKQCNCI